MMKERRTYWWCLGLALLLFPLTGNAQQLPLNNVFHFDEFILNPALAGRDGKKKVSALYRRQWSEIPGAPETGIASFAGFFEDYNMAAGAYMIYDKTGPTSQIGLNGSYAYHLNFDRRKTMRLSVGLTFGLHQYRLNGSELLLDEPDDVAAFANNATKIMPDAGLGISFYTEDVFVGFSVPQILSVNLKFQGEGGTSEIRRVPHYYFNAGGRILVNDGNVKLSPLLWIKYAPDAPVHADIFLRTEISNVFGLGFGYSTSDAIFAEFQVKIADRFHMVYGLTVNLSPYRADLGLSHDMLTSFIIDDPDWYY